MKKRLISLSLVLACSLFITGCEKDKVEDTIYKKGLPEDSLAFKEFMRNNLGLSSEDITLSHQGHSYLMTRSDTDKIRYFKYTDEQLHNSYKPIFSVKKDFPEKLSEISRVNFYKEGKTIHNKLAENLPDVTVEKKNMLKVKTTYGEKKLAMPPENEREIMYLKLEAINKENMLIQVRMSNESIVRDLRVYYLFLKKDLSKHQIVEEENLYTTIESGKLNDYLSVFPKVSEDGSYLKLFDNNFLKKKTNKVRKIKDTDYLSLDGKYVYINGRKEEETSVMPDGVQKIQTVDNYFKGTDKYEAQFEIDYGDIADEVDISSGAAGIAHISYFNKDFVVLSISYNGFIVGTAGSTNVLIDLQKNKNQPTAYLVDLGIS
ncbi:hypothetical protein HOO54_20950 [Bacillus sp. WMMC1349]|uniref:hypothetical protein n=1 Tax=Bacillus sp. WMMC1349 TaxID=2736254 RepID=UPI001556437F|nr:hypothetical protein [Bacillus sp. WMMC1349]NPC94626.1 hypothetical protein [Bacillus sp. WMMC1349]